MKKRNEVKKMQTIIASVKELNKTNLGLIKGGTNNYVFEDNIMMLTAPTIFEDNIAMMAGTSVYEDNIML